MNYDIISPLDGRYFHKVQPMRTCFSERNYIELCLKVELKWLRALSSNPLIPECKPLLPHQWKIIGEAISDLNQTQIDQIKDIESKCKHDIKAIEYYLKTVLKMEGHDDLSEFVHFGLTSEDITNIVYAISIEKAKSALDESLTLINNKMYKISRDAASSIMLSRTHGQVASPTTFGKEMRVFENRLSLELNDLRAIKGKGKIGGASGNLNALVLAYPQVDWITFINMFIFSFDLKVSSTVTQVENHDWIAKYFHSLIRINNILVDMCQDIWLYMARGYVSLDINRVGSSTMPHKINPIEFENAEGNMEYANAMLQFMATKLAKSRLQRDLSGSTVKRNVGVVLSHCYLAYWSIIDGLQKLTINDEIMKDDLNKNPQVLTEAIQTIFRKYGVSGAYESVKEFSNPYDSKSLMKLVSDQIKIPEKEKVKLIELQPDDYLGYAEDLASSIKK